MIKKGLIISILTAMILLTGCGGGKQVSLTKDEKDLIEKIGSDVHVVEEDSYADTVTELINHTAEYTGNVFQLEGKYTEEHNASVPYVYRTLVNGDEETFCGLPLIYLQKDLEEGDWIRVTGIINQGDVDGTPATTLEVIAVESLSSAGKERLDWDGSAHEH